MQISLQKAVQLIKENHERHSRPYVFLVGAGISAPSVPLAAKLQEVCKDKMSGHQVLGTPQSDAIIDQYSFWLQQAFPDPAGRLEFFKRFIEDKPITAANFHLAHLLAGKFTNIVITPNFDDFLHRALRLFGNSNFKVYDHPETADRVRTEDDDIQILHVHGSYRNYDIANLRGEIRGVSRKTSGATSLLTDLFKTHAPIVVGYSGWKDDVITSSLLKSFKTRQQKYAVVWFCHSQNAFDSLHDSLKSSECICFVVPSANPTTLDSGRIETLSAQRVFAELINALGLKSPLIARDPLEFFAKQLETAISTEFIGADPYALGSLANKVRRARSFQVAEENGRLMEDLQAAFRSSSYRTVTEIAGRIVIEELDGAPLVELIRLLSASAENMSPELTEAHSIRDLILRIEDLRKKRESEKLLDSKYLDNIYTDDNYTDET
jgi:hypothetical protein